MGELIDLIPLEDLGAVTNGIHFAIAASFEEDIARAKKARLPEPSMTRDEIKRRFDLCLKIYRQLRGDLQWGRARALDHVTRYLRLELDQVPWEPDSRKVWAPGDGA